MPVLECTCGMVMSVSAATPRGTCIRCGGAKFRKLFAGPIAATCAIETVETSVCATPNLGWSSELLQVDVALLPVTECAQLT